RARFKCALFFIFNLKHNISIKRLLHQIVKSNILKYPEVIYPVDYGHLKGIKGGDGSDLDVWVGQKTKDACPACPSKLQRRQKLAEGLDSIVCTVDIRKKDTEIKLLLGCTEAEKQDIVRFLNNKFMSAMLIERT
ncbi:hypothetical protein ACFLYU_05820, partial [Candidatus Dependentiae bacterium]